MPFRPKATVKKPAVKKMNQRVKLKAVLVDAQGKERDIEIEIPVFGEENDGFLDGKVSVYIAGSNPDPSDTDPTHLTVGTRVSHTVHRRNPRS